MSWFDEIEERANQNSAVETRPLVRDDGTRIDTKSVPSPKLVINIDRLKVRSSKLGQFLYKTKNNMRYNCDYIILTEFANKITIILVEAKRGGNIDANRIDANRQLQSSIKILETMIEQCTLFLPFDSIRDCDVFAVCVMEALSGGRYSDPRQRNPQIDFAAGTNVPFLSLTADRDIWDQIREQRL